MPLRISGNLTLESDELSAPGSKSWSARALILAAIKKRPIKLYNLSTSRDTRELIYILKKIGIEFQNNNNGDVTVLNSFPACEIGHLPLEIDTGEGGTTNRFILPLLALGRRRYTLRPHPSYLLRPQEELFQALKKLGAKLDISKKSIQIQGPLELEEEVRIDCSRSTQFASALTLVLGRVIPENLGASEDYYKMTLRACEELSLASDFRVPTDWSSLVFLLGVAALTETTVSLSDPLDLLQADTRFIGLLESLGLKFDKGILSGRAKGEIEMDVSLFPDSFPMAFVLGLCLKGKHIFKNTEVLKHKETDRLQECLKLANLLEVEFSLSKDYLELEGKGREFPPFEYQAPQDHRMAMSAAVLMGVNRGGVLRNEQTVEKSFPEFFTMFKKEGVTEVSD